jgi:hypothetical protein
MVAIAKQNRFRRTSTAWQDLFLTMLPAIRRYARLCFRRLPIELREEYIQEALCNVCVAIARLADQGKLDLAYPCPLAHYAVAQVKSGRKVGGHLNCRDVLSPYCQRLKNVAIERLDHFDREENGWLEAVIQDTRTAPVPDIVSFRMDFGDWLSRLPWRKRLIAESLAVGNRTGEVADRFHVSAGRIAQLRNEFYQSWRALQQEA